MALNQQFDSLALTDMVLPYAPNAGPLTNRPFFGAGLNSYVTWGGTLKKRPGTNSIGVANVSGIYPERLWVYETLEASPVVYLVGSFLSGGVYILKYSLVSSLGNWTTVTERRGCNHSVHPHEGVVRRGKLYIKGDPSAVNDASKLGAIYLDGTGGSMATHDWGALGPQTPVAVSNPSGWSAAAHPVSVLNSWIYTYTYVKVSGQETDQASLQTNPDNSPSSTGPFTNKIPTMTVTGLADTTEYPFINIYRTTDGGGTFFFLWQITNTGAGNITFKDTFLASGSGNADPIPDALLDTAHQAPSTTSNGPPPTTTPPNVTGTNNIVRCSHVADYASRIWFAINEYLFYSANEELVEGIPEESFPSGIATPNFFRFTYQINNLVPTPNGLLVMSERDTSIVLGTSRATFNPVPLLGNIGGAYNQPRASCTASDKQAWLTHDYRIAVIDGSNFAILSNPIGDAFKVAGAAGAQIDIQFWTQSDKEYLIVAANRNDNTALTQWWVYDLDRARRVGDDFWFTPWQISSTCLAVGPVSVTDTENKLFIALYDGTNFLLANLDYTGVTASDVNPTTGAATAYGWNTRSSLLMIPPGDHVNQLRRPNFSPTIAGFLYDRTLYSGDSDPTISAYFDDLFTNPVVLGAPTAPPRREQSQGFKSNCNYDVHQTAQFVAFLFTGNTDTKQAEIHNAVWVWLPESGA